MIHARIAGATAVISSRKRRIVSDSQPVHVLWGPWQLFSVAKRLPSEYHARNSDTAENDPAHDGDQLSPVQPREVHRA